MSRRAPPPYQPTPATAAALVSFRLRASTRTSVEPRRRPATRDHCAPYILKIRRSPTLGHRRRHRHPRRLTQTSMAHCTKPSRWCRSHSPSPAVSSTYYSLASVCAAHLIINIAIYLYQHFVAYSTQEISIHTKTQYEEYTPGEGWYSAITCITPKKTHKRKTHKTYIKTKNLKIDYCNLLNRTF